jgi:FkbM family methyltransferase
MDEIAFHTRLYRPGTVLDVGAHDGLLTIPFARLPGSRVLAFEPLPSAFARLTANLAAAFGAVPDHVTLHRAALGDRTGEITLAIPVTDGVPNEQWASMVKDYAAHAASGVAVRHVAAPVMRLDALGLTDLTHAKIDAEGAEYEVLRGGHETLSRCRPVMTLEVEERHRAGSTWAIPAYLDALGYDCFFELDGAWLPIAALDRATMQRASADPTDFLASDPYVFIFHAIPRERVAEALALFG